MVDRADAEAALLRARLRIGMETEPVRFLIDRSDLRRYARACGETWPAYAIGDLAPPTFMSALQSEGMGSSLFERDLPFQSMLHSDDSVELHHPIKPGDTLIAISRFCDAVLKDGRHGPMLFQTAQMRLKDSAGRVVGTVSSSLVSF